MSDKKYYWLKLPKDFFTKHYILMLKAQENGDLLVLFYIRLLTESIDHEGTLRYSETKPYTPESLSGVTGFPLHFVTSALQIFTEMELIVTDDNGTIILPKCMKMIGSESTSTERVRRYRNRQNNSAQTLENTECNTDVTRCNKLKRKCNTEKEIEIEIEIEKEIDIEKNTKKELYFPNDESLNKVFADFVAMRNKIKRPMTDRAIELAIKKLNDLSGGDNDTAIKIIEQSIMNSWQGLFPLKEAGNSKPQGIDWSKV